MLPNLLSKLTILLLTAIFPLALMAADAPKATAEPAVVSQPTKADTKKAEATPLAASAVTATVAPAPLPDEVIKEPTTDELAELLKAIGGAKGAGAMAIVMLIVQGLALLFRSALGKLAGIYQILIINGLTLIGGVIGLKMAGVDWGAALLHSQTLVALQVFANQLWKQWLKKNADQAAAAKA